GPAATTRALGEARVGRLLTDPRGNPGGSGESGRAVRADDPPVGKRAVVGGCPPGGRGAVAGRPEGRVQAGGPELDQGGERAAREGDARTTGRAARPAEAAARARRTGRRADRH